MLSLPRGSTGSSATAAIKSQWVVVATVVADDVAESLDLAWWAFREAAGDDLAGWDMAAASAEVQPADA
jgi:hypothetical protein